MATALHPIREAMFCLQDFAIAAKVKRLLVEVALDPKQTFWHMTAGVLTDFATIEWCKVFGSYSEATHWRNVVPRSAQTRIFENVLAATGLNQAQWTQYRRGLVNYRNKRAAHADPNAPLVVTHYPHFDGALRAAGVVWGAMYEILPDDEKGGLTPNVDTGSDRFVRNMKPIVVEAFKVVGVLAAICRRIVLRGFLVAIEKTRTSGLDARDDALQQ